MIYDMITIFFFLVLYIEYGSMFGSYIAFATIACLNSACSFCEANRVLIFLS